MFNKPEGVLVNERLGATPGAATAGEYALSHSSRASSIVRKTSQTRPQQLLDLACKVAGAAWGGWYFANRMEQENVTEVSFHRLTFRRGEVRTARFAPDGDTIVYSAAWDGNPSEVRSNPSLGLLCTSM